MAKSGVPNPLERRILLEKQLDPAHALRIAEAYLAEERVVEAVAFLRRADAREACSALGRSPAGLEWQTVADAAGAAGKLRYAEQARRQQARGEG